MNKREKEYLLYYLDQLSLKLRNSMSEIQQGLNHLAEISRSVGQELPSPPKVITFDPLSTDKFAEKPAECLISIREVCLLVSVSRSTIYRMVEEGSFPKPLDMGPRFKAWQKRTVVDWIVSHDEN